MPPCPVGIRGCAQGGGSRIKDQGSRIKDQGSKMRASQQGARWEPAFLAASAQLLASLRASSTARSGLSEGALRSARSPAGIWFTACSTIHCRGATTTTIRKRQRANNDNDQKQRSETRAVRNPSSAGQPGGRTPPPPPSRTDWTRLVPPPVLTGHVSSLLPYYAPASTACAS